MHGIRKIEIGLLITFFFEGKDCVRSGFHTSVNHSGKVNAQKWEVWIGYRIYKGFYKVFFCFFEFIILAAERNNSKVNLGL